LILKKKDFYEYLNGTKELNEDTLLQLKNVVQKYPYFQTAKLLLLKNIKDVDDASYKTILKNVAIECADREKLFYFLNSERYARFFPNVELKDEPHNDRTELLLHSFLESIEESEDENEKKSKAQTLESDSIVSTDYLAYLEKVEPKEKSSDDIEEAKPMKHQQLLDDFLEKSSSNEVLFSTQKRPDNKEEDRGKEVDNLLDDDAFLTETLAQVYIKQKKYEQALTIIKKLSLSFPKKSIYFADQIRFLEHLILNDKNKKQK